MWSGQVLHEMCSKEMCFATWFVCLVSLSHEYTQLKRSFVNRTWSCPLISQLLVVCVCDWFEIGTVERNSPNWPKKRRQTHRTHYCDTKTKQLLWYIWTSIHGSLMVWHHQRRYLQSAFPPYQISKTGMVALRTMSSLIASLAKIQ